MIYKQALLNRSSFGSLGNAGADAYMAVINSGGTPAMAEAASRNASSVQTYTPGPVVSSPPPVIITNTADPVPVQTLQPAPAPAIVSTPTRQTTQPVISTVDSVAPAPVVNSPPPAVFSSSPAPTVNTVVPNVTYNTSSPQYDLTPVAAGAGAQVPDDYTTQDVVATPAAPVVSSASIPWGLLLSLGAGAYEAFKK